MKAAKKFLPQKSPNIQHVTMHDIMAFHNYSCYLLSCYPLVYKVAQQKASSLGSARSMYSYNTGTPALPDIYARLCPSGVVRIISDNELGPVLEPVPITHA